MRRPLVLTLTAALAASMAVGVAGTASAELPTQAAPAAAEAVPGEVLIGYDSGASDAAKARARGRAQAAVVEQVVAQAAGRRAVELVRLPQGRDRDRAIADIASDPAVAYAEPNFIYRAAGKPSGGGSTTPVTSAYTNPLKEPYFTSNKLWGLAATATVDINDPGTYGSQAVASWTPTCTVAEADVAYIGVIDEGIKVDHAELAGQVQNPEETSIDGVDDDGNGYVDDTHGWDFVGNNRTVYDGGKGGTADNHGTHVAGTIAAKSNGTGVVGVALCGVRLISAKFLGQNGGTLSDAVEAVDYFTDLKLAGVNIVATNNSWGGGGYSSALRDAIGYGARAGILFIAAAGNGGSDGVGDDNDGRASYYPSDYDTTDGATYGDRIDATYNAVVAVAALDRTGKLATFSNFGSEGGVHIAAPGADIWSTTANNGGYSSYNGTSMATPHVSAAVAVRALRTTPSLSVEADASARRGALLTGGTYTAGVTVLHNKRLNITGMLAKP